MFIEKPINFAKALNRKIGKVNEEIEAPFEHRGFAKRSRDHANTLYRDERAP